MRISFNKWLNELGEFREWYLHPTLDAGTQNQKTYTRHTLLPPKELTSWWGKGNTFIACFEGSMCLISWKHRR